MSAEEKLTQRIYLSGSAGVKKSDLRKEFPEEDIDVILEKAVTDGDIYIDKKGAAYYCWHREYFLQSLLNSDAKFRIMHDAIKSLERSINKTSDGLAKSLESSTNNIILGLSKLDKKNIGTNMVDQDLSAGLTTQLEQFKTDFDNSVSNYANSIGWVEFAKIRNELCTKYEISHEEFYRLVEQLINKYDKKYELSTGGYEGITIRGLIHGFVRCI
ncbi:MAG TPA: hypothetical protein VE643_08915 [Nitrososphaeraceae archaeon]|nr:hypothetical protein [Nitrososphaeraceae archaeon]